MTEATPINRKAIVMRIWILLFLIGMGLRVFQTTAGDAPVAAAAETAQSRGAASAPVEPTAPTSQVGQDSGPVVVVRPEWLDRCDPAQTQLGLYAPGDASCQPRRTVSLNWLQSQLASAGMLAGGEYLEKNGDVNNLACPAVVLSGPAAQPAGWLCADARGLYRADSHGQPPAARFQLWIQGR